MKQEDFYHKGQKKRLFLKPWTGSLLVMCGAKRYGGCRVGRVVDDEYHTIPYHTIP